VNSKKNKKGFFDLCCKAESLRMQKDAKKQNNKSEGQEINKIK
jgi:hypothetical protein